MLEADSAWKPTECRRLQRQKREARGRASTPKPSPAENAASQIPGEQRGRGGAEGAGTLITGLSKKRI